ncbi:solute carrier family 4 member 4 [Phyllostomus discolor]|uniref:Solute carrier family 4 member 4 n=1 Tax=Phyllostomus discolor TaxID=89673 RepID=A0A834BNM8_9CHIR|nr:solute carrier family 4 member 4 [Phyllostomus discolor]
MNNSLQVNLPRSWAASSGSLQEKSEHSFFLFYYYRMEDEAVLDRGASFLKHVCDEEEVEGHHTIYIGVHVPKSYRRRRRHKRKTGHKDKKEKERISENYSDKSDVENADESGSSILKPLISPAAERIRFILGEEDDSPAPPQLFTELDELLAVDGQEMEWKETARWIKFEEKVEQGGERWSKPHVATLSLHSLFELRTCMEKGSIMLDREAASLPQLVGEYVVLSTCHFFSFSYLFVSLHQCR